MAKKPQLSISPIVDGRQIVKLQSWNEFYPYITTTLRNPHDYIFRGQRRSSWKLESSFDRAIKSLDRQVNPASHFQELRLSARGRRGVNPQELGEEEWWALGRHYGLWTPLLDWTESPFVALYFTFEEPTEGQLGERAVFALSRPLVEEKSASITQQQLESPAMPDIIKIIMPELDENARLVSQGGLFTRSAPGVDIEKWVKKHFRGEKERAVLVKIVIPEKKGDRFDALCALNRMNINHKSLFPDISGSAEFCNMRLSITGY
jgi:hypothetical protein